MFPALDSQASPDQCDRHWAPACQAVSKLADIRSKDNYHALGNHRGHVLWGHIAGKGRGQSALFPVCLDDLLPADHPCRVIEAFVASLDMGALGFIRATPAGTGRPGYDRRDLLKIYLYGYLQQIRSSRRLEAECQRNVELMWLVDRLVPDHKVISEFRRHHSDSVAHAGASLVQWARAQALLRGGWVAIDGSKFRAVSSTRGVKAAQEAVKRTWRAWMRLTPRMRPPSPTTRHPRPGKPRRDHTRNRSRGSCVLPGVRWRSITCKARSIRTPG